MSKWSCEKKMMDGSRKKQGEKRTAEKREVKKRGEKRGWRK